MSQRVGVAYQLPTESVIRTIDWSSVLRTDTIASSSWTITPSGLTTVADGNTNTTATIQLTGGTAGVAYQVENAISTAAGQNRKRHFLLTVQG